MTAEDSNDIRRTLDFLHPGEDTVFEARIIGVENFKSSYWQGYANKGLISGYFNSKSCSAIINNVDVQCKPKGIYVTLNPPVSSLLARAANKLKGSLPSTTSDKDISSRHNLLIDVDPCRAADISSSDDEKQAAFLTIQKIRDYLDSLEWPEPLFGDSGNGFHLIYKIDLPNTDESTSLVKKVLQALAARFNNSEAKVDQAVFNAARITKIYGTWARKGDSIPERPHRLSAVIYVPENPIFVSLEQLEKVSMEAPVKDDFKKNNETSSVHDKSLFDIQAYLRGYGREVKTIKQHGGSNLYVLNECIFDSSHKEGESSIGQCSDGKLFYQCFHDSCKGKTWKEARNIISGDAPIMGFNPNNIANAASPGFFQTVKSSQSDKISYVHQRPPKIEYLFDKSFPRGLVGGLVGPQAAGKSTQLIHIAASVATGKPLFGDMLVPARKGRVLCVFAEENEVLLWNRLYDIVGALFPSKPILQGGGNLDFCPPKEVFEFDKNVTAIPAAGKDLRLIESKPGGDIKPSKAFEELLDLCKSIEDLALVILDPLSRFYGQNENDNSMATVFVSLLERIANETGANVIISHHVSKSGASDSKGKFQIENALHQDAIRGASAFSGAFRWQFNLFPMDSKTANKNLMLDDAPDNKYLVGGVVKNNNGPKCRMFLERKQNGILKRHDVDERKKAEKKALWLEVADKVCAVVKAASDNGERLTPRHISTQYAPVWKEANSAITIAVINSAILFAVEQGNLKFELHPNAKGKETEYLALDGFTENEIYTENYTVNQDAENTESQCKKQSLQC